MTTTAQSGGWLLAFVLLLGAALGAVLVLGQLRHDALRQDLAAVGADVDALRERLDRLDGPGGEEVIETELARFRRLKETVDEEDRRWRYTEMIGRQLDRLGVVLADAQRARVVEVTMGFRDKVRDAIQASQAAGEDRAARQARLEALRDAYEEAIRAVVPAAEADRIVESMGRYPGFGFRREGDDGNG